MSDDQEQDQSDSKSNESDLDDVNIFGVGVAVELFLAGLALVFAWFGFFDASQPLANLGRDAWQTGLIFGLVGTIPMLAYLIVFHFWKPAFMKPMDSFVDEHLVPIFKKCSLIEMAILSLLAGFCEELFFRWCLQGGMSNVAPSLIATIASLVAASVLFGICHWVNNVYGIATMIVGMYLGLLMIWTGSFLAPAIAHALFDFVAMIYIGKRTMTPVSADN